MNTITTSQRLFSIVVLSCVSILHPSLISSHEYSITIDIPFNEDVFTMENNEHGQTEINTLEKYFYSEENEPGLPLVPIAIAIPSDKQYSSNSIEFNKRLYADNVTIAQAPIPFPTDGSSYNNNVDILYDTTKVYPYNNCKYVSTSNCNGIKTLHFLCCPYIYDSKLHELYFIDSIRLNISLIDDKSIQGSNTNSAQVNLIKNSVINPQFFDTITIEGTQAQSSDTKIDYVIITNNNLKSSFEPLRVWKTIKGINSVIITTEDINATYSGADLQVKIKKCLYDLYLNNSLTYALLGGDDKIVPVRGCYGAVPQLTDNTNDYTYIIDRHIPTDMYYACFGGDFEWNQNSNDIYGELDDNIDLSQNIFVTRAPVYTTSDTEAFVNKIIEYETNPTYNNNILMSGCNLYNDWNRGISDAQRMGANLYSKYIKPYWKGDRYQFYDSYTDFEGSNDFELNAQNLSSQLNNGYSFVEMTTHGQQTYWELENGKYNSSNGLSQTNSAHSIITTIACYTNAFDSSSIGTSDPCLSESLIRNPSSGVVAYLGCSRQGWARRFGNLGISHLYEASFFEKLFDDGFDNKNYGIITAAAKYEMIGDCNTYGATRWVQFGLNPIGDPEMPIYTEKPDSIDIPEFSFGHLGINVKLDLDNIRMCLTDAWDYGEVFYERVENKQSVSFSNLPSECILCITKQNYLPKLINLNIIQNKTFTTNRSFASDVIAFGSSVTTSEKTGTVEFASGSFVIKGSTVILGPGTTIAKGAKVSINN